MALKRPLLAGLGLALLAMLAGCLPILPADYPDAVRHPAPAASAAAQVAH